MQQSPDLWPGLWIQSHPKERALGGAEIGVRVCGEIAVGHAVTAACVSRSGPELDVRVPHALEP